MYVVCMPLSLSPYEILVYLAARSIILDDD